MSERTPIPTEERKPAWRAACLAYRKKRRVGALDHEAYWAAVVALQELSPGLLPKEVQIKTANTISYASTYHSEWFWSGVESQ